jgi:molybdopterin-guanine dinucleotide biosynthesis protein A
MDYKDVSMKPKKPLPASAIVLAGGDSRRMGRDKALLPVGGKRLIEVIVEHLRLRFEDILISARRADDYRFLGLEVVGDAEPGLGPLRGLASTLPRTKHDIAFVTACDIPWIDLEFVERLIGLAEGFDLVLPFRPPNFYEPLFAVYRRSVAGLAEDILAAGQRSLLELLSRVRVRRVEISEGLSLGNINTRADYRKLVGSPPRR